MLHESFRYCKNAVVKLGIQIKNVEEVANLGQWCRVVKFYTLRLMFAPLIETVILLDRFLFLEEIGEDL